MASLSGNTKIPSISMTGGHGESFSKSLAPCGECFVLPGVGENNPEGNFACFCNDGLDNESVAGKSFLFSFSTVDA